MGITSKLASINPFKKDGRGGGGDDAEAGASDRGDDKGDLLHPTAGGDIAAAHPELLRVSPALRKFISDNGILSPEDAGVGSDGDAPAALKAFVARPHIRPPAEITDRSHPLTDYYMSSSHNTYLLANQLYGTSCPSGYELSLKTGARCVEVDAWDNPDDKDEPKVTHGFTLVSHIPFRTVCEVIRDVVDAEKAAAEASGRRAPAPVFLSLENHCGPHGQQCLVDIMKQVWGDRLLSEPVRAKGHQEQTDDSVHVYLDELGSQICVMVEYHFPNESDEMAHSIDDSDSGSDLDSDTVDRNKAAKDKEKYNQDKKQAAAAANVIIPELAAIGVYVQSVKPPNDSWFESTLENAPHHHLINISETGLGAHLPKASRKIAQHNALHLMRVYPKGTRIGSSNLQQVPFWGIGAQVCALNWQRFGASIQINNAMFAGTDGFVLKPAYLRGNPISAPPTGRHRLRLRVVGGSDSPSTTAPYVSCVLLHPDDLANKPPKRKTGKDRSGSADPFWDETLEWEYAASDLVFVRILLKSDERMARNPVLAAVAVRLLYAVPGWNVVRLCDMSGRPSKTSLLVHFDIQEVA